MGHRRIFDGLEPDPVEYSIASLRPLSIAGMGSDPRWMLMRKMTHQDQPVAISEWVWLRGRHVHTSHGFGNPIDAVEALAEYIKTTYVPF